MGEINKIYERGARMSFLNIVIFTVLLTLPPIMLYAKERSLTISPVGFTYHALLTENPGLEHSLGDGESTMHFGVNLKYKKDRVFYTGFVFNDSYKELAGGLLVGYNFLDTPIIDLGIAGGPYVKSGTSKTYQDSRGRPYTPYKPPVTIASFGKDVDLGVMGGATITVTFPVSKTLGVETNCLINVLINHCQLGLNIRF